MDQVKKTRILIVEDEIIIGMGLQMNLENMGYDIIGLVDSRDEAMGIIEINKPDLVLMDIVLKMDGDGIGVAEEIRRKFDIPVVYITAYSDETTVHRAKISEPYGYIMKPYKNRELSIIIEFALYRHKADNALRIKQAQLEDLNKNLEIKVIERTGELLDEVERRKKAENEIKIFKRVMDNANYGVVFLDSMAYIIYINSAYSKILGYKPEDLTGNNLQNYFSDDEKGKLAELLRIENEFCSKEILHRNISGLEIPMLLNGTLIRDGKSRLLAITAVDITELKQMETALRHDGEVFREMADFLPASIVETDNKMKVHYINKNFLNTYGYDKEEVNPDIFHPADRERIKNDYLAVLNGKSLILRQYRIKKKGGNYINTLLSATPIFKNGLVCGLRALAIDIKPFFLSTILPDDSFFKQYSFTSREKEIMNLLAQGYKYKEIAKKLKFSENTLKSHMSNIYDKMGAASRDEIVDIIKEFQVKYLGKDRLFFSILSMLMQD